MGHSKKEKDGKTTVTIAIFHPRYHRSLSHWAIWLKRSDKFSVLLQVAYHADGFAYYVADPVYKEPRRTLKNVHCAKIPDSLFDKLVAVIQGIPVRHEENPTWNCQHWVLDAIDELERGGYIKTDAKMREHLLSCLGRKHLKW